VARVGFVGLGNMGAPMARNVAAGGHELVLHDADPGVVTRLAAELGATAVTAPADFAGVDAIVTMLPTSKVVAAALFDCDGGVPPHLAPGTVVIDMSSSDPTQTVELGERLRGHGVDLVDAPVSGGVPRAVSATLSIMLGGDSDAALDKAVPIIETMSSTIFRTGKLGTGHAMKALNNFVAAAALTASCEALVTGERFGLDPHLMVDVLNASTGQSFSSLHVLSEHVVDKKYATGFGLALITKDVGIAEALHSEMHHDAPVARAVLASLDEALAELGPVDHSAAMQYWEKR
jgi:3-hydroxyisobutyrate dehydrogenase